MVDVRYASNVEDRKCCECVSWLDYWIKRKNTTPVYCRSCIKKTSLENLEGVHVQKLFSNEEFFIVPVCAECRNKKNELPYFDVEDMDLVKENE